MRRLSLLIVICLGASTPAGAQDTTPWGDPDLRGIWTNQTPVSLERPDELAGKEFFTEEEAVEFERTALERLLDGFRPTPEFELTGDLSEIWLETQDGKVPLSRRTSL